MTTIRCIYHPQDGKAVSPAFPATDQHPDAARYLVGLYYVDAIGGKPTQAEIDAVLNPPPPPAKTLDEKLAAAGLTREDIKAASVEVLK